MSRGERIFGGICRITGTLFATALFHAAMRGIETEPWWSACYIFGALGCLGFFGVFETGMMAEREVE